MNNSVKFVAADLGASSGRVMVGQWNGRTFSLDELHRFANGPVAIEGSLRWNALNIWSEIQLGLGRFRTRFGHELRGVGVDAWGVDFALLDNGGQLLGDPFHYRDSRTDGIPERVFQHIDERALFSATGVQTMQINTLFQLYSMVLSCDSHLTCADTLLMIPDLFHYFLSGVKSLELTEATTTQLYALDGDWFWKLIDELRIPQRILPSATASGTILGPILPDILRNTGLVGNIPVITTASHDTANAVAAIPLMDHSSAFISSGTWSLMGAMVQRAVTSDRAFALKFTNEAGADGSTLLMKNMTGLWILQECLRHWASEGCTYTWEEITAMAYSAPAFYCVLDVDAPEFRMPDSMPKAIAAYCESTGQSQPQDVGTIARCCLESLSLKYHSVLQALEVLTARRLEAIRIVGGGCLNRLLCQFTANACNRPVVSGPAEASAMGNIMMQAVATGHLRNMQNARTALTESIQCISYLPHGSDIWNEAALRLEHIQSIACQVN